MNHKKGPTTAVRVRPATKKKIERIAKANRWSLVETADALADHFNDTPPASRVEQSQPDGGQPVPAA